MRKLMTLTLIGLMLTFVIASCKSAGHCEAYGNKSGKVIVR